jgi:uncharacterized protein
MIGFLLSANMSQSLEDANPSPPPIPAEPQTKPKKSSRIDSVDALRGFALAGIMLLHNVEQFNYYHQPDREILFFKSFDPAVWTSLFFLFGGKAYAIFSLLFGFSFWVQFSRMQKKNYDMGGRFVWRMALLFLFGIVHSLYYSGDLLIFYATFGLGLVLFRKVSDGVVLAAALFLLLIPLEVWQLGHMLINPAYTPAFDLSWKYWGALAPAQGGGTFFELVKADITSGLAANVVWTWEVGRIFHIPGLFLLGMLAARRKAFTEMASKYWGWILASSLCVMVAIHFLSAQIETVITNEPLRKQMFLLVNPYDDVFFMLAIVSTFILLWRAGIGRWAFSFLIPYGRMSLTNYTTQALIGTFVYYEWGLGLHHYFGATLSLFTGIFLLGLQLIISHWWLTRFDQGPLEKLWRKAMWIGAPEKLR